MGLEVMDRRGVMLIALCSRVIVFSMQILFNWLVNDHQPDVFNPPDAKEYSTPGDRLVEFLFGGFRRWDAVYFIHIAEHGYTYENSLAFFPAFPLTTRAVGFIALYPLHAYMTARHVLMIGAFLANTLIFVWAAAYVYDLGRELIGKGNHPWFAAVLFCFNPASIFMSAAYSEPLYALGSFAFMYHIEKNEYAKATIAMAVSTATRSNGVVLAGFPIYQMFKLVLRKDNEERKFLERARDWLRQACCVLYGVLPFAAYQYIIFHLYCKQRKLYMPTYVEDYGRLRGYRMPHDSLSEWCYYTVPISYGYIQSHYWNVGFLTYYEWRQLPNFLLATPVILLSLYAVTKYVFKLKDTLLEVKSLRLWIHNRTTRLLPYTLHLLFLTIFGICNLHIQVLTRFIFSSSPLIYLFLSRYVSQYFMVKTSSRIFRCSIVYFCFYFVFGTIVFCNFLPWT